MRWRLANKATPAANRLADRHYSTRERRARKPAKQVGAPGRLLVLVTEAGDAFWISRIQDPAACLHAWPGAWECSAFRNESTHRASELVEEALAATFAAWGLPPPRASSRRSTRSRFARRLTRATASSSRAFATSAGRRAATAATCSAFSSSSPLATPSRALLSARKGR